MANEPIQVGTDIILGLSDYAVSGVIMTVANVEQTGDQTMIKDESANDVTIITSNLGTRLTLEGVMTTDVTSRKGDIVTVDSVAYVVEDVSKEYSALQNKLTLKVYKPDALSTT